MQGYILPINCHFYLLLSECWKMSRNAVKIRGETGSFLILNQLNPLLLQMQRRHFINLIFHKLFNVDDVCEAEQRSARAPGLGHRSLRHWRVLQDDLRHRVVLLGLCGLHARQRGGHPAEQLLDVVAGLGGGLDKHHI